MHPLSTVLFLAGYGLALPLAGRIATIVGNQQRLAFAGHQVGVLIALIGWLTRGAFVVATLHAVWVIATKIWYAMTERKLAETAGAADARPSRGSTASRRSNNR